MEDWDIDFINIFPDFVSKHHNVHLTVIKFPMLLEVGHYLLGGIA
jgi:hypothetical protein